VENQTKHKSRNSKLRDIGRHRPARRLVDRVRASVFPRNFSELFGVGVVKLKAAVVKLKAAEEDLMGLGRGLLLWLIGIPLPIIILIALFMHH
jgi:hypothetical protein